MAINGDEGSVAQLSKRTFRLFDAVNPIEDQLFITSGEMGIPRKFLQDAGKSPHVYVHLGVAAEGGTKGLQALPNMGMGRSAGSWGMQGALVIVMFALCYMLYMLIKKRVCSLTCGWKDKDDGDLELDRLRDA